MDKFSVKLPDTSDSLYIKVPDATDSVYVRLPGELLSATKLTSGGENAAFHNYNVDGWGLLPDATPMPLGTVHSVAYNPAATLLAVGASSAPTLILYDTSTLTSVSGPPVPASDVMDVVFNKSGTLLAFASETKVYIYNTSDWSLIVELDLPGQVEGLDFNYAGTLLGVGVGFGAAAGEYLYIYDTATWSPIAGPQSADLPEGWVYTLDFSPDDSMLAVGNHLGLTRNISIYNTASWGLTVPTGVTIDAALECRFNNAQTELLLVKEQTDYFVRWDTSTWQILSGTPTLPAQAPCIDINDDDSYVAIGTIQNVTATLFVYDTSTWAPEALPPTPNNRIEGVAFQPTDPTVVCFYIVSAVIGDPEPEQTVICFNEPHENCNTTLIFDFFSNGVELTNTSVLDQTSTCITFLSTAGVGQDPPSNTDIITLNHIPNLCAKAGDPACALQPFTNYPITNKILGVASANIGFIGNNVVQVQLTAPAADAGNNLRVRVNGIDRTITNTTVTENGLIQLSLQSPVTSTDTVTLDHINVSGGALAADGRKLYEFTNFFIDNTT